MLGSQNGESCLWVCNKSLKTTIIYDIKHWDRAHINVNVGHQLRGDVFAALPEGGGRHVCITVPAAADGVGVGGSRWSVLDSGSGDNADRLSLIYIQPHTITAWVRQS